MTILILIDTHKILNKHITQKYIIDNDLQCLRRKLIVSNDLVL